MKAHLIRRCTPADATTTLALVDRAFAPDTTVGPFLTRLRREDTCLGEWLAEGPGNAPIGYIAFWRGHVGGQPVAILTPLAVDPDHQNCGIGKTLMAAAHADLEAVGERTFLVLGHPTYYPRAGYDADATAGIDGPWSGKRAFMLRGERVAPSKLIVSKAMLEE